MKNADPKRKAPFPDLRKIGPVTPPFKNRFPKGVSGNRAGRPPGSVNHNSPLSRQAKTMLEKALFQPAKFLQTNNRPVRMTVFQGIVEILMEQASLGGPNALVATTALAKYLGIVTKVKRKRSALAESGQLHAESRPSATESGKPPLGNDEYASRDEYYRALAKRSGDHFAGPPEAYPEYPPKRKTDRKGGPRNG